MIACEALPLTHSMQRKFSKKLTLSVEDSNLSKQKTKDSCRHKQKGFNQVSLKMPQARTQQEKSPLGEAKGHQIFARKSAMSRSSKQPQKQIPDSFPQPENSHSPQVPMISVEDVDAARSHGNNENFPQEYKSSQMSNILVSSEGESTRQRLQRIEEVIKKFPVSTSSILKPSSDESLINTHEHSLEKARAADFVRKRRMQAESLSDWESVANKRARTSSLSSVGSANDLQNSPGFVMQSNSPSLQPTSDMQVSSHTHRNSGAASQRCEQTTKRRAPKPADLKIHSPSTSQNHSPGTGGGTPEIDSALNGVLQSPVLIDRLRNKVLGFLTEKGFDFSQVSVQNSRAQQEQRQEEPEQTQSRRKNSIEKLEERLKQQLEEQQRLRTQLSETQKALRNKVVISENDELKRNSSNNTKN
eukprot:m.65894 g.65894  ORF g.65894 m.65894 type:complete len:416 (-) comp11766_c0_seq1:81-1328(-)